MDREKYIKWDRDSEAHHSTHCVDFWGRTNLITYTVFPSRSRFIQELPACTSSGLHLFKPSHILNAFKDWNSCMDSNPTVPGMANPIVFTAMLICPVWTRWDRRRYSCSPDKMRSVSSDDKVMIKSDVDWGRSVGGSKLSGSVVWEVLGSGSHADGVGVDLVGVTLNLSSQNFRLTCMNLWQPRVGWKGIGSSNSLASVMIQACRSCFKKGSSNLSFPTWSWHIYIYEKKQSIQKIEIWKISRISSAVFRVGQSRFVGNFSIFCIPLVLSIYLRVGGWFCRVLLGWPPVWIKSPRCIYSGTRCWSNVCFFVDLSKGRQSEMVATPMMQLLPFCHRPTSPPGMSRGSPNMSLYN